MSLTVKCWQKFQHYKDRAPPWIKLYRDLLDDLDWHELRGEDAKALIMMWIIASENDGALPPLEKLAFRLRMPLADVHMITERLLGGWLMDGEAGSAQSKDIRAAREKFGTRYISDETKRAVFARDAGKCRLCGSIEKIEYDHVTPVSKGGTSEEENLQLLCRHCNRAKRAEQPATPSAAHACAERITETEKEVEKEEERESPPRKRGAVTYSEKFEKEFWLPYPRSPNMSKLEAWNEWKKLSSEDHEAAIAAVPRFKDWASKQREYTPVYADRFLKRRRFDGFQPTPHNVVQMPGVDVAEDSPERRAWDDYGRSIGKTYPKARMWRFPTQWPPTPDEASA